LISAEIKRFMIHPNKHANKMVIKIEKVIMTFLINSKLFRVSSDTFAGVGGIDENIMNGKTALAIFQRMPNPIRPIKTGPVLPL
jgi:ABC-type microcin C transport system duplicated ATPase subunit YejF